MIFATVGSMLPFDRFVRAIDAWAGRHSEEEVFIQIGSGLYQPRHAHFSRMLIPGDFENKVAQANIIVAHAGMGSVILAAQAGKPIVLLPRRRSLGEHNTDHQLHTVSWLRERSGILVAMQEDAIEACINEARLWQSSGTHLSRFAPPDFVARLRSSILTLSGDSDD